MDHFPEKKILSYCNECHEIILQEYHRTHFTVCPCLGTTTDFYATENLLMLSISITFSLHVT